MLNENAKEIEKIKERKARIGDEIEDSASEKAEKGKKILKHTVGEAYKKRVDMKSKLAILQAKKKLLQDNIDFFKEGNKADQSVTVSAERQLDERRKELIEVYDRLDVITTEADSELGNNKIVKMLEIQSKWNDYQDRKTKLNQTSKGKSKLDLPDMASSEEKIVLINYYDDVTALEKEISDLENQFEEYIINREKMDLTEDYISLSEMINQLNEVCMPLLTAVGMIEADTQRCEAQMVLYHWKENAEKLVSLKFNLPLRKVEFSELLESHLQYRKLFFQEIEDPNPVTQKLFEKIENKMVEKFQEALSKAKSPEDKIKLLEMIVTLKNKVDCIAIEFPPQMNNQIQQLIHSYAGKIEDAGLKADAQNLNKQLSAEIEVVATQEVEKSSPARKM